MKAFCILLSVVLASISTSMFGQSYRYDSVGRLISVTYPAGEGVRYAYDIRDNITSITSFFAPRSPENLKVTRLLEDEFKLSWDHIWSFPGEGGTFVVESSIAGSADWTPVGTRLALDPDGLSPPGEVGVIGPDDRSTTVSLEGDATPAFRIVALGSFGEQSAPSGAVQAPSLFPFYVTTHLDENDNKLGMGEGDSLREVIQVAASGDVIKFGVPGENGQLTPLAQEIELSGLELRIEKNLTIDASEHPGRIFAFGIEHNGVNIDGDRMSRVLHVSNGAVVALKALRIESGMADFGAGLFNEGGEVTIQNCFFLFNNSPSGNGGGIFNSGTLEIVECTFGFNAAEESAGGAIYNDASAPLKLSFSRFYGNSADVGGGIFNTLGTVTVASSYFENNRATEGGGAIVNFEGNVLVENTTISRNVSSTNIGAGVASLDIEALDLEELGLELGQTTLRHTTIVGNIGQGVYNENPVGLTIDNSIVANNKDQGNNWADVFGDFTAVGANLVRIHKGELLGGLEPLFVDPLLEDLVPFLGGSNTMPPRAGSPVIDAGIETENTPSTDQQSSLRPFGSAPDLGAVESRLSAETELSWLTISEGHLTPPFRAHILDYNAAVPASVSSVAVRPAASVFGQTIKVAINGGPSVEVLSKAASSDLPLIPGENVIEVSATSESGTVEEVYAINVVRGDPIEENANLSTLSLSSGTLGPSFRPENFEYNAVVANNVTAITLDASPSSPEATFEIRSNLGEFVPFDSPLVALKTGSNVIELRVTSNDQSQTSVYTVSVEREATGISNPLLAALSTSAGSLSPLFSRGVSVYQLEITDDVTSATVTAVAAQSGTSLRYQVNGGAFSTLDSAVESGPFGLAGGTNRVEIEATAQDGTTRFTYVILIDQVEDDILVTSEKKSDPRQIGDDASFNPSISEDGRFLAFSSRAMNLVDGDTNFAEDVFVYDRENDTLERVSVADGAVEANDDSTMPSLSTDGRYVAFQSEATNLVPDDTNGDVDRSFGRDIFVYDRETDMIDRVSLTDTGGESNQASERPSISGDGRFVAFVSGANNLVTDCDNGEFNVYLYDRTEDTIVGIPVPAGAYEVDPEAADPVIVTANLNSLNPAISSDGRFVAFEFSVDKSEDSNPGYQYRDIYYYDRFATNVVRITGSEIGLDADGTDSRSPSISSDGRYIAFQSNLEGLDFHDTNSATDVFVFDRVEGSTRLVSLKEGEAEQDLTESTNPSISGGGQHVAFESRVSNFVVSDENSSSDIFVKDLRSGLIKRVSESAARIEADGESFAPSISSEGLVVAFESNATNLVDDDSNFASDIFVAFTEDQGPNSIADLLSLSSNIGANRTGANSYQASVSDLVQTVTFRPVPADPEATVEIRINAGSFDPVSPGSSATLALDAGPNTVEIKVTAEDGSINVSTVTIDRYVPSDNADLLSLTTSSGDLDPAFDNAISMYRVDIQNGISSIRLTPTTTETETIVTVDGSPVVSGTSSKSIGLAVGGNTILIDTIAEDGVSVKTVAVSVFRAAGEVPRLVDIGSMDGSASKVEVTWESQLDASYTVEVSNNLRDWEIVLTGVASQGYLTASLVEVFENTDERLFLRVRKE